MHELSIVLSIVNSVQTEVAKQEAKEVRRIELDIGNMAGIEWDSFDFAWEPATKNTVLEKAERVINHIPAMATCVACNTSLKSMLPMMPAGLRQLLTPLQSGKELKIKSLVIA
jgi:hydrogenase nickel incorporation protein HypA/HybF